MYRRDFGILLLSAFAVYYAMQNEGPFTFRKAWCAPLQFCIFHEPVQPP